MPSETGQTTRRFDAAPILGELIEARRRLHENAEIGLDLPKTQAFVLDQLSGLDVEVTTGRQLSSVTAVLRGGKPGPTVLLRGDMDALPFAEPAGLPFASTTGAMHACGHDLHTAGLLGAARLLHDRRADLPGSVIFMFQPGEEGYAGARHMIEEGVLDAAGERPVAAYAVHVDCVKDGGTFFTRGGPMLAGAGGMEIRITGTGGHPAFPEHAVDPIPIAAEIVLAIQSFVARRVPASDPAVVSVMSINSEQLASNALPITVTIKAFVRSLSYETSSLVREKLPALVSGIAAAHGAEVSIAYGDSYPVTVNDAEEAALALDVLQELHGRDGAQLLSAPLMATEDFSYVLQEVPGALIVLGARPANVPAEGAPGMHSVGAVFDDGVLARQAEALAEVTWRRLNAGRR